MTKRVFLGKRPAFFKYSPADHHAIRIDDQIWNLSAHASFQSCSYKFQISTEPKDNYEWTFIGDYQNEIKYLTDDINKSINQYHLIYQNCQIIAEIVLNYVVGKKTLKQAIAIFQKVKQCKNMKAPGLIPSQIRNYLQPNSLFQQPKTVNKKSIVEHALKNASKALTSFTIPGLSHLKLIDKVFQTQQKQDLISRIIKQ